MKRIVISDLHLGNPFCNRNKILEVLSTNFDQLIVNGDIYSLYHKLSPIDDYIVKVLEDLQLAGRAVFIKGNHELLSLKKTNLKFINDLTLRINDKLLHFTHGHNLKKFFSAKTTRECAIDFAYKNNFDGIFIGHTHRSELFKTGNIIYGNSGSFVGIPSYIKIGKKRIELVNSFVNLI